MGGDDGSFSFDRMAHVNSAFIRSFSIQIPSSSPLRSQSEIAAGKQKKLQAQFPDFFWDSLFCLCSVYMISWPWKWLAPIQNVEGHWTSHCGVAFGSCGFLAFLAFVGFEFLNSWHSCFFMFSLAFGFLAFVFQLCFFVSWNLWVSWITLFCFYFLSLC